MRSLVLIEHHAAALDQKVLRRLQIYLKAVRQWYPANCSKRLESLAQPSSPLGSLSSQLV